MYYPYLRGKQFELIAIRELLEKGLLSDKVIPIIEPLKITPSLLKTIDVFQKEGRKLYIVINPIVGQYSNDFFELNDIKINKIPIKDTYIKPVYYLTEEIIGKATKGNEIKFSNGLTILNDRNVAYHLPHDLLREGSTTLIPNVSLFKRNTNKQIVFEDHFPKMPRNSDYEEDIDIFFSDYHLPEFKEEFVGFSDYSIIGSDYQETGFAPYAVAIHIVHFDENDVLYIRHFKSDSNDSIEDPARKLEEALKKLVIWNRDKKLNTFGIKNLVEIYNEGRYPGLGFIKKLSLMHHLEIMSEYLDGR